MLSSESSTLSSQGFTPPDSNSSMSRASSRKGKRLDLNGKVVRANRQKLGFQILGSSQGSGKGGKLKIGATESKHLINGGEMVSTAGGAHERSRSFPDFLSDHSSSTSRVEYLYLRSNLLRELWDMKLTENLVILDISENEVSSLAGLEPLTKLEQLYANSNAIVSLEGFPEFQNLEILSVSCNRIRTLEGLGIQPKMEVLYASDNDLNSLTSFPVCLDLRILRLSGNPVASSPNYRVAVLLASSACGIMHLGKLDGQAFAEEELAVAVGLGWPQRLSTLYGWLPTEIERSYEECSEFLLKLQIATSQSRDSGSAVWLSSILGDGRTVEDGEVSFDFAWNTITAEGQASRAKSLEAELGEIEDEILRMITRALKKGKSSAAGQEAQSLAVLALQKAEWRLQSLPEAIRSVIGGIGGKGSRLFAKRQQLRKMAKTAKTQLAKPDMQEQFQWFRVNDSGHAEKIPGATHPAYRATMDDIGYTLKAECTCMVSGIPELWPESPVGKRRNSGSGSLLAGDLGSATQSTEKGDERTWTAKAFAYTRRVVIRKPEISEIQLGGRLTAGERVMISIACNAGRPENVVVKWYRSNDSELSMASLELIAPEEDPKDSTNEKLDQGFQMQGLEQDRILVLSDNEEGFYIWAEGIPLKSDGSYGESSWICSDERVAGATKGRNLVKEDEVDRSQARSSVEAPDKEDGHGPRSRSGNGVENFKHSLLQNGDGGMDAQTASLQAEAEVQIPRANRANDESRSHVRVGVDTEPGHPAAAVSRKSLFRQENAQNFPYPLNQVEVKVQLGGSDFKSPQGLRWPGLATPPSAHVPPLGFENGAREQQAPILTPITPDTPKPPIAASSMVQGSTWDRTADRFQLDHRDQSEEASADADIAGPVKCLTVFAPIREASGTTPVTCGVVFPAEQANHQHVAIQPTSQAESCSVEVLVQPGSDGSQKPPPTPAGRLSPLADPRKIKLGTCDLLGERLEGAELEAIVAVKGELAYKWYRVPPPDSGQTSYQMPRSSSQESPKVLHANYAVELDCKSSKYVLTNHDVGCTILVEVMPLNNKGPDSEGSVASFEAATEPIRASAPLVTDVKVVRLEVAGSMMLRGAGKYSGGQEGKSKFVWVQSHPRKPGSAIVSEDQDLQITSEHIGSRFRFGYLPCRSDGEQGEWVYSPLTEPMAVISEEKANR